MIAAARSTYPGAGISASENRARAQEYARLRKYCLPISGRRLWEAGEGNPAPVPAYIRSAYHAPHVPPSRRRRDPRHR